MMVRLVAVGGEGAAVHTPQWSRSGGQGVEMFERGGVETVVLACVPVCRAARVSVCFVFGCFARVKSIYETRVPGVVVCDVR